MTTEKVTRSAGVVLRSIDTDYEEYRRSVIFRCCKWDPQVGDVATIGDHACLLTPETALHLADLSERLAAETVEIETALRTRPHLFSGLGIPRQLARLLSHESPPAVRVMRFDFHPTDEGGPYRK